MINIKAIGKTIEHEGETVLLMESMPPECIVLFIDKESWDEAKKVLRITE